jgi:hypothetical protein
MDVKMRFGKILKIERAKTADCEQKFRKDYQQNSMKKPGSNFASGLCLMR